MGAEVDEFYIFSESARTDDRTRVLKHADTFAVFDRFGNIEDLGKGELGLYHQDTRFLSRLVLHMEDKPLLLLSSTIKDDNSMLTVDFANPDIWRNGEVAIPRGSVHAFLTKALWESVCHERLRLHNYGLSAVELKLSIELGADFTDIFEVRGARRERRGRSLATRVEPGALLFAYEGLDGRVRRTRVNFDPLPVRLTESRADYEVRLEPRAEMNLRLAIACELDPVPDGVPRAAPPDEGRPARSYEDAVQAAADALARSRSTEPVVFTANEQFNDWLNRSIADLHMMRTMTVHGPYPYAGVPWFSTPFGRDGIITALECLWFDPAVARGVLTYLADTQANTENAEQDAEPGKVLHETRAGEMASLGEVPFARYYGTIDATPLFVVLAGAYYERTGDLAFAEALWPHVERALEWLDRYGDRDRDGFVEYARRSDHGLVHQGWKDSQDPVFHEDGRLAEAPIALCEVQGYAYAAQTAAVTLAKALGRPARAQELAERAERLQARFEATYWCEDLSTYALALDGEKRPCRVRTSNPGHCLFAGIVSEERARKVASTLLGESSFSGWGIRTVGTAEARYNPMSYHNGSVWPHDNALIGAGFARYGLKEEAATILQGLFEASIAFELHRLPELFCGFPRRAGESPTLYPVSCAPQAWASGAVLLLLQACLGLEARGAEGRLVFTNPVLPPFLPQVIIRDLRVGGASLDLLLTRHERDVGLNVLRREGSIVVEVVK